MRDPLNDASPDQMFRTARLHSGYLDKPVRHEQLRQIRDLLKDQPRVRSNFISTLGYGDPASLFERLPRPDFERFSVVV